MMRRRNAGFSAMEVVVSILVLAFAVLPVLHMMTSGRKTAALTEYHVLAQLRARRILEIFSSYPYEALMNVPQADGGGMAIPVSDTAFPPEYKKKLARYEEFCFFEELKPGLGLMTVKISWTITGGNSRKYMLQKLLSDEGMSLNDNYPLRQQGVKFIK